MMLMIIIILLQGLLRKVRSYTLGTSSKVGTLEMKPIKQSTKYFVKYLRPPLFSSHSLPEML